MLVTTAFMGTAPAAGFHFSHHFIRNIEQLNEYMQAVESGDYRIRYCISGDDGLLAVVILDSDHFEEINDSFGHGVGDEVLRRIARVVQVSFTGDAEVGRYGGEEFMALSITPASKWIGLSSVPTAQEL